MEFALAEGKALPAVDVLTALPGVRRASVHEGRVTLIVSHLHAALPALLASVADPDAFTLLTTHSATLEDVFVALTGGSSGTRRHASDGHRHSAVRPSPSPDFPCLRVIR